MHINYTTSEVDKAIAYYVAYDTAGGNSNSRDGVPDGDVGPGSFITRPILGLFTDDASLLTSTFDLGTVTIGQSVSTSWTLTNLGPGNLRITDFSLSSADPIIEVIPNLTGSVLTRTAPARVDLRFRPTQPGRFSRTVNLTADNGEQFTVTITGQAVSPTPVVSYEAVNNNVGGQPLGGTALLSEFATVGNAGAQDLVITNITLVKGAEEFSVVGFTPGSPVTLRINAAKPQPKRLKEGGVLLSDGCYQTDIPWSRTPCRRQSGSSPSLTPPLEPSSAALTA